MTEKELIKKGKFLSLILRHEPDKIGLTLDKNGWALVSDLLSQLNKHHHKMTMHDLEIIVETNNKKRYSFNEEKTKIRANQGHSLKNIDLDLEIKTPPDTLYHGTTNRFRFFGISRGHAQDVVFSIDRNPVRSCKSI